MKKLICIVLLVAITFSFSGCTELLIFPMFMIMDDALDSNNEEKYNGEMYVEYNTGISIPECKVVINEDTHGGFLGDGETFIQLFIPKAYRSELVKEIEDEVHWHSLPMTEIINSYISDVDDNSHSVLSFGEHIIPNVTKGYWYFHDSHSDSHNEWSDEYMNVEVSHNYEVAVYDTEKGNLYFFEYDS